MPRLHCLLLVLLAAVLLSLAACKKEEKNVVHQPTDPERVPTMTSHDVQTVVSDSGQTRYRITTKLWQVFQEAHEPHWTFPDGMQFELLDSLFRTETTALCDSAYRHEPTRRWSFIGHVKGRRADGDKITADRAYYDENSQVADVMDHVVITRPNGDRITCDRLLYNTQTEVVDLQGQVVITRPNGDLIKTDQMYYERKTKLCHSPAFIHVESQGRVIEGTGYEFHENDKTYQVTDVQGIFPVNDQKYGFR